MNNLVAFTSTTYICEGELFPSESALPFHSTIPNRCERHYFLTSMKCLTSSKHCAAIKGSQTIPTCRLAMQYDSEGMEREAEGKLWSSYEITSSKIIGWNTCMLQVIACVYKHAITNLTPHNSTFISPHTLHHLSHFQHPATSHQVLNNLVRRGPLFHHHILKTRVVTLWPFISLGYSSHNPWPLAVLGLMRAGVQLAGHTDWS